MTNNWLKNKYFLLPLIIVVGIGLRLINLSSEPYWGDEILSVDIVQHYQNDVAGMITYLKTVEIHPPLYYLMLYGWSNYFGFSELGTRSLSVIFGIGVILLTYLLTKKLFNREQIGLLAAFFVAVLPFQIEFSQEARPYIIYTFFGLLAATAFWSYRDKNKIIFLLLYAGATFIGLNLHYSYIIFALPLAAYWLGEIFFQVDKIKRPKALIIWLIVHGLTFLAYYSQFIILLHKVLLAKFVILETPRTISPLRDVNYLEALFNQLIWLSKNNEVFKIEVLAILLFKLVLLIAIIYFVIKNTEKIKTVFTNRALLFTSWLTFTPAVLFLLFPQGISYAPIFERHIITCSVLLMIVLSYLIYQLNSKLKLLLISLFLVSIFNFIILIVSDDSIWDPYHRLKIMADHINQSYQTGDLVLINFSAARSDFNHYLRSDIQTFSLYPLNLLDFQHDFMASRKTLGLMENESQLRSDYKIIYTNNDVKKIDRKMNYLVNQHQPKRIWMVFGEGSYFREWFLKNNWREIMSSAGSLFPVKLYAQR